MKKVFKDDATIGTANMKWYKEFNKSSESHKHSKTDLEVLNLIDEGKRYLDADTAAFQAKESKSRDSEKVWLRTALTKGTTSDKVAAGIVLIQDNAKYNLPRLVSLVNQVRVSKHNQSSQVITALRDLFLSDLLHPTCKLLKFKEQNLDEVDKENEVDGIMRSSTSRRKLLALWYFEDQLKEQYERFVLSLGTIASDTVDTNRETAISVMTDLLIGNAEQEHKLLELIVNKVGDPSSKVGSKAVFCLNKLLHEHPNMKLVVLREIEKLLFRKNVGQRAQYYAICLLTQFLLSKDDTKIAATLIEVYFAFFKACLKKGEPDSRMMAVILTGVNRAYPFAQMDSQVLNEHIDSVYKVVHVGSFSVSLNALNLLHQVTGKDETQANRFYSAFYRKLLDPEIAVSNKRAIFLNLLFRVLQRDTSIPRLYAFIKRILQITIYFPPNMACATLYVVSKILKRHKSLKSILIESKSGIRMDRTATEIEEGSVSSDRDNTDEETNEVSKDSIMITNIIVNTETETKLENEETLIEETEVKSNLKEPKLQYDPFCRNPLYAGITKDFNIELLTLTRHYHPSVALFANTILKGNPINYTGDPLEDLALMRFLDRYVFKNPKKLDEKKVQRQNDPLAKRAGYTPKGIRRIPVDSASYLNEREERIPVDELYLYRFLKGRRNWKRSSDEDDDDLESVNSEEFNEVLDKLGDSKDMDEFDVAADLQSGKKKSKKDNHEEDDNLGSDASDQSDINDDIDNEVSEEEFPNDEEADSELQDLSDIDLDDIADEDLSDMDFNDDSADDKGISDDEITSAMTNMKEGKIQKGKGKKRGKGIDENIFVSAEKFAEMLEEQSRQKTKHGSSNMLSDLDGASTKQLEWETKRHQKLHGSFHNKKRKAPKPFKKNSKKMKH